jgi:hypothetical protein
MIATEMEEVIDLIVGREEPLRLASRFELLHLALSSARRLVRVPLCCSALEHDLPFGRAIAGKLVGDHDAWRSHLPPQQLAQQPLGHLLVASALDRTSSTIPVWSTARHNQASRRRS